MIKRILTFIAPVAVLVYFTGCVGVTFSAIGAETVVGSGPMKSVEYTVGQYTAVKVDYESEIELYYTAAQSDKVVIELQENLAEHFEVSVADGVLTVKSDKWFRTDEDKVPKLYISTPTLEKIDAWGAVAIKQADTIKADSFSFNVRGAADGALSLEVGKINFDTSGACDITFSGSADEAVFSISGAGSINAIELQAKDGSVNVSGAGSISVNCSDTLDINVSGTGSVTYKGTPQVTQNTSGAVSIQRVD